MKLINEKTGEEVKIGDAVTSFRGETMYVRGFRSPKERFGGMNGKMYVTSTPASEDEGFVMQSEYYPGVFDCKFVEE